MELQKIYQSVVDGSAGEVQAGVQAALAEGVAADVILNQALIAAMEEVGKRFEEGDFFVPEMLIAARAMQSGLGLLKPHLIDSGVKAAGKVAMEAR
ncbi:MAG: B12-binding domain-containing protein [Anaerolineales bacterium]|nr:B12-binding domain-containing protein [Anaerolineales bacterium]